MHDYKYKVFISYSHADEQHGDWLQRALETYSVPRALVGEETPEGVVPRRLTPVFRDRDDLPAAGNLNAEIQAALQQSHFQVVLCSPNAAQSKWVNEEIKLFKKLHGPDRTLAVIVAGEPGASAIPGREAEECFPPALRFRVDDTGAITDEPAEPIAADARKGKDGKRTAVTKLAAGLIGVRLDDLVQREAARRTQRAWWASGASATLTGILALLTVAAVNASREARFMRGEAENLVEFMLTDLRDKLEPVGRLDVLEAVGERAMNYYDVQDLGALDGDALNRRAKAMLLLGNIEQRRNDLDAAYNAYLAAEETTAEQLRRAPNNADRVFDHAQSVFYVGDINNLRGAKAAADEKMLEYHALAQQLAALEPDTPRTRLEQAYATSNLGSMRFYAGNYDEALDYYEDTAAARRALFEEDVDDSTVAYAYAYALSWVGFVQLVRGDYADAADNIAAQLAVYDRFANSEQEDYRFLDTIVTAQRRLVDARLGLGDIAGAAARLTAAKNTSNKLIAHDGENANWIINASYVEQQAALIASLKGRREEAETAAASAIEMARRVYAADPALRNARQVLAQAIALKLDRFPSGADTAELARELESLLQAIRRDATPDDMSAAAGAALALIRIHRRQRDSEKARMLAREALAALDSAAYPLPAKTQIVRAGILAEIGEAAAADDAIANLKARGVAHPDLQKTEQRLAQLER